MSWNTHTDSVAKDAITVPTPHLSDVVEAEQAEQFQAAVDAAKALARVVGRDGDEVIVTMSGHANPGHGPREGWANEMISVTVSARPAAT